MNRVTTRKALKFAAVMVALLVTIPVSALATTEATDGFIQWSDAAKEEFVEGWTSALLSKDPAALESMPKSDIYNLWTHAEQLEALDALFENLEASRPADASPITDPAQIAATKNVLGLFIFNRDYWEKSISKPEDPKSNLDQVGIGGVQEEAQEINDKILSKIDPVRKQAEEGRSMWVLSDPTLNLRGLLALAGDNALLARAVEQDAHEGTMREVGAAADQKIDEVKSLAEPYKDRIQHLVPVGGTYTLHLNNVNQDPSKGTPGKPLDTWIQNIPFGVPVPLDIDSDGRTGAGGIDLVIEVGLERLPGHDKKVSGTTVDVMFHDVAPALKIERMYGHDGQDAPDLAPLMKALVEVYVSLNAGKTIAHLGVDGRERGLPNKVHVVLSADVNLHSTTIGDAKATADSLPPLIIADVQDANKDLRTVLDAYTKPNGIEIPWSTIDGTPGEVQKTLDEQRAFAEREVAPYRKAAEDELRAQEKAAHAAIDPVVAEAQKTAKDTTDPVLAEAETQRRAAQQTVDETMAYLNEQSAPVRQAAEEQRKEAQKQIDAANTAVQATAKDAEAEAQRQIDAANRELAPVKQMLAQQERDTKATAYPVVVDANLAAGEQKNYLVWTANGLVKAAKAEIDNTVPAPRAGPVEDARAAADEVVATIQANADPVLAAIKKETDPVTSPTKPLTDDVDQATLQATMASQRLQNNLKATTVTPGDTFRLEVLSDTPHGDIILVGGVANLDREQEKVVDYVAAAMRISPPPAALKITFRGEPTLVRLEATTPTTLTGLVLTATVGGKAAALLFVIGPLPTSMQLEKLGNTYKYTATGILKTLAFSALSFWSYADYTRWLNGGALSADWASFIALNIPTAFTLNYSGGGSASYRASGRLGLVELQQARIVNNGLSGYYNRALLVDIPSAFDIYASDNRAFYYSSNGPLGILDILRTNGAAFNAPAPGFAAVYKRGGIDLAQVRLLGLISAAMAHGDGGTFFDMRLAGGYPFYVGVTMGSSDFYGWITSLPNHIGFTLTQRHGADVSFIAEPQGIPGGAYFVARNPALGSRYAYLGISNIPSSLRLIYASNGPWISYGATDFIRGFTVALVEPWGYAPAYVSFYNIPPSWSLSIGKFGSGLPFLSYGASHSTLSFDVWIDGNALGVFPGHLFLRIVGMPRQGLYFGADGGSYYIRSWGDRLPLLYLDVGYRFAGRFDYDRRFVDNWILTVGAYVHLYWDINIKNFYLILQNLAGLNIEPRLPMLNLWVDGVFSTYFNLFLDAGLSAGIYIYLLGWFPILNIGIWWGWYGPLPIFFYVWNYAWYVWEFILAAVPIICGQWWSWHCSWRGCGGSWHVSWGLYIYYIRIGLRLPSSFWAYYNGFSVAYGGASVFINPGNVVPFWLIYIYAVVVGFDWFADSGWRTYC